MSEQLDRLRTRLACFTWRLRRASVLSGLPPAPFTPSDESRWLLVSQSDSISAAQTFPMFYYSDELHRSYGIGLREVLLKQFWKRPPFRNGVDVVCFQTWFDLKYNDMMRLVDRLRSAYPAARLVYLDWFAPTDLRYAEMLAPHVDVYVKKHLLSDRSYYGQATLGDTNLTDYYSRRFELNLKPVLHKVPSSFWSKLVVGSNFALSAPMLKAFAGSAHWGDRPIDVHARFATNGTPWYSGMRSEAYSQVLALKGLKVVTGHQVERKQYWQELYGSKICFSPFGYGEVCWRDFEAAFSGALLIKPDMSHIQSTPDIFEPFKSYVPTRWDLSDLEEKIHYYLEHPAERKQITDRAYAVVRDYLLDGTFLEQFKALFEALALPSTAKQSAVG